MRKVDIASGVEWYRRNYCNHLVSIQAVFEFLNQLVDLRGVISEWGHLLKKGRRLILVGYISSIEISWRRTYCRILFYWNRVRPLCHVPKMFYGWRMFARIDSHDNASLLIRRKCTWWELPWNFDIPHLAILWPFMYNCLMARKLLENYYDQTPDLSPKCSMHGDATMRTDDHVKRESFFTKLRICCYPRYSRIDVTGSLI